MWSLMKSASDVKRGRVQSSLHTDLIPARLCSTSSQLHQWATMVDPSTQAGNSLWWTHANRSECPAIATAGKYSNDEPEAGQVTPESLRRISLAKSTE